MSKVGVHLCYIGPMLMMVLCWTQVSVVSTVIATLFLRTTLNASSVTDGQTYLGLIFFAIIHMVRDH